VAVIGPKTAEALLRVGINADVVAQEFVGEGLAASVVAAGKGGRALLLRALVARDALPEALREHGFQVDVVAAYETSPWLTLEQSLPLRFARERWTRCSSPRAPP
jgi:uroporphyrinogen III methyltransferase/synthase